MPKIWYRVHIFKEGQDLVSVVENSDGLQLIYDNADTIDPEEGDGEDGEQPFYPLLGVGVAFLREKPEQQREGDTPVGDGLDESVDVEDPELQVGAVHG